MKKTELILIAISIVVLLMRFFHLPGSAILTVISLSSVSVFYLYLGFMLFNGIRFRKVFKKESYKGISTKRIFGGIGTGIALSFSAIGILFKFQSWPGASFQLGIGLFGLTIVTLISLTKVKKNSDNFYSNILKRVAFFGALSIFLLFIPSSTWLNWKYPNNPEYVKAILNAQANPNNEELWKKVEKEREKMRDEKKN